MMPRNLPPAGPLPSRRATALLTSPGFLLALGLLLLNDHLLKARFGNWFTGKLSDFAGLFAFALFWMALLSGRRRVVCIMTAAAFAIWKSPLVEPLIAAWNARAGPAGFAVVRVVDPTDLLAILVLPGAAAYARSYGRGIGDRMRTTARRLAHLAVGAIALFAFAATSAPLEEFSDGTRYVIPAARPTVRRAIDSTLTLPAADSSPGRVTVRESLIADTLTAWLDYETVVDVELTTAETGETIVTLLGGRTRSIESSPAGIRRRFAERVVLPLRSGR